MRCILFVLLIIFSACSTRKKSQEERPAQAEAELTGEQLSQTYCSGCHLYPSPGLLDKKSWKEGVLPQMGYRFGIYEGISRDSLLEKGIARKIVEMAGIFPVSQTIDIGKWVKIKEFYLKNAPDSLAVKEEKPIKTGTSAFKIKRPKGKKRPLTTSIRYDGTSGSYLVASSNTESSSITIFSSDLEQEVDLGLPFPVSEIAVRSDTMLVLMMGHFVPSDEPAGALVKAFKGPGDSGYKGGGFAVVLNRLQRPVDMAFSDVNGDGLKDIVVCEYGNHTGSLSLFLKRNSRVYDKKVLNKAPGAIKVIVQDVDNDALEDIVALMAQGDEGVDIYYNKGNAVFQKERVLRFPPSYGSVSFSLVDFNKDGFQDILYTNGDNADYSPVLKPYHGVRIFLNDGANYFTESYFFHQNGAYQAVAGDFDGDGDPDIASVSFFPDFSGRKEEGFVYLENRSTGSTFSFEASTIEGLENGRWMVMDAADIDKDGDTDLMLGSFTGMEIRNDTNGSLLERMVRESSPFVVLENTAR